MAETTTQNAVEKSKKSQNRADPDNEASSSDSESDRDQDGNDLDEDLVEQQESQVQSGKLLSHRHPNENLCMFPHHIIFTVVLVLTLTHVARLLSNSILAVQCRACQNGGYSKLFKLFFTKKQILWSYTWFVPWSAPISDAHVNNQVSNWRFLSVHHVSLVVEYNFLKLKGCCPKS